jgi:predicted ATPase
MIYQSWASAQQGQVDVGMAQMHQSIAGDEAMGAYLQQPSILALLAELYGQVGQPEEGLRLLDKALDQVEARGERWSEAEIYRLRGELLRIQGADTSEVESHFLQALAITQQQEAKSLELRAAMSLSRLWQAQGRSQEAHALLAGIYRWFTEGFSTPDLVEARILLEELS